mgnify:CR=1 FL=1
MTVDNTIDFAMTIDYLNINIVLVLTKTIALVIQLADFWFL